MVKFVHMKKGKYIFPVVLLLIYACAQKVDTTLALDPISIVEEGSVVVEVYDYKGFKPLLKQENDTTYVVNFWATWCKPCVKELPYFEMLGKLYKSKKVKVLLVSLDMESQIKSKLIPFIKKQQLESRVVVLDDVDANSWISNVNAKWTGSIPATIIYNKKKRLFFEKSFTYKELETQVKRIL